MSLPPLPPIGDLPLLSWLTRLRTAFAGLTGRIDTLESAVGTLEDAEGSASIADLNALAAQLESTGASLIFVTEETSQTTINPYDADYDYVRVSASGNVTDSGGGPSSTGQPFLQLVVNAGSPDLGARQLAYGPTTTSNYDFHLLSGWVPMADISDATRYFRLRQVLNDSPDSNVTCDWVIEKVRTSNG